jgi:hypothetical protein
VPVLDVNMALEVFDLSVLANRSAPHPEIKETRELSRERRYLDLV